MTNPRPDITAALADPNTLVWHADLNGGADHLHTVPPMPSILLFTDGVHDSNRPQPAVNLCRWWCRLTRHRWCPAGDLMRAAREIARTRRAQR